MSWWNLACEWKVWCHLEDVSVHGLSRRQVLGVSVIMCTPQDKVNMVASSREDDDDNDEECAENGHVAVVDSDDEDNAVPPKVVETAEPEPVQELEAPAVPKEEEVVKRRRQSSGGLTNNQYQ